MLGNVLLCLCMAGIFVGPPFLLSLQLNMLPGRKKKREAVIDRNMEKSIRRGKKLCRVTAVLKRKTLEYRDSFNGYSRNYVYEYSYKGRNYRYRLWMRRGMPQTMTLYFMENRPRRVRSEERELFAPGKRKWLLAYLLVALFFYWVLSA